MKRILAMTMALLFAVLCFAACGEKTVPAPKLQFDRVEDGVAVLQLTFNGETYALEDVGTASHVSGEMTLSIPALGDAEKTAGTYVYPVPEAYATLRKREVVDGILVYWGAAYGVVTDETGHQKLFALDETLTEYDWTDFYNRALRWQKKNSETSGGTGLA